MEKIDTQKVLYKEKFMSDVKQLKQVRLFLKTSLMEDSRADVEFLTQLMLVVDEAFTNIVKHAYMSQKGHPVFMKCFLLREGVIVELCDQGISLGLEKRLHHNQMPVFEESGRGIPIITSATDWVDFNAKKRPDEWNRLRVFKSFKG